MMNDNTSSPGAAETALTPHLIDIGINLTHDSFDPDRDAVLARARAAGVVQMMVTGSSLTGTQQAIELARNHPGRLFATAGVHPHHATELTPEQLGRLAQFAADPRVVAVGECGLDYFRNYSPRAAQQEAFHRQLELAARVGKPVFLHQRDAHEDFIAILREHRSGFTGGVAHCFTGTAEHLASYLEHGLFIGITGWICDERRGTDVLALVPQIPAGRLLLETDGPYLLPRDLDPKPVSRRNEPAFVRWVACACARVRGETLAVLGAHTTSAARALFGLPVIDSK